MGPLGMGEIVVLFILALLVFGPKKLPELGKTFGKGMAEFKRASNELKTTFQKEMDNIEQETKDVKSAAGDVGRDINKSYYYDDNEDDYYSGYDYDGAGPSSASAGAGGGSDAQSDPQDGGDSPSDSPAAEKVANDGEEPSSEASASAQPVSGVPEAEEGSASNPA